MTPELLLLILAGFVLYPLCVGVSYRFLGGDDRIGIIRWLVCGNICSACGRLYYGPRCPHTRTCTRGYSVGYGWFLSAAWPLTWTFILICYLAYYAIWQPVKLLALATAKTAQLTSGEK